MAETRSYTETLKGYARGVGGGLLFSIAPLYTMEIWWQGYVLSPWRMLVAAFAVTGLILLYAHYCGLHADKSWRENAMETLQIVALSTFIATVILKLAGQLPGTLTLYEIVTRIAIEGTAVAIGVAVGSTQFGANSTGSGGGDGGGDQQDDGSAQDDEQQNDEQDEHDTGGGDSEKDLRGALHEFVYMVLGGLLISFSIAPTAEITMIAVTSEPWQVLVTAILTLILGAAMTNYAQFRGTGRVKGGVFAGGVFGDACVAYAVGLVLAAGSLWLTGMLDGFGWIAALNQTVYLGVAATLGGAAGRLLL